MYCEVCLLKINQPWEERCQKTWNLLNYLNLNINCKIIVLVRCQRSCGFTTRQCWICEDALMRWWYDSWRTPRRKMLCAQSVTSKLGCSMLFFIFIHCFILKFQTFNVCFLENYCLWLDPFTFRVRVRVRVLSYLLHGVSWLNDYINVLY